MKVRKFTALLMTVLACVNLLGCSLQGAKDAVVNWYSNIDINKFKDGWDAAVEFVEDKYSSIVTDEYISNVEEAISKLKEDIGSAADHAIDIAKDAVETGLEAPVVKKIIEIGQDIYSIFKEAATTGSFDEKAMKNLDLDRLITERKGFVEGAVSRAMVMLCMDGAFGEALVEASPAVVAALSVLVIEAGIHGYELSKGLISAEDFGQIMADRIMVGTISIPTTTLILAILPATKLAVLAGCMAGGLVAGLGYTAAKSAILDIVDRGGLEAVVPAEVVGIMGTVKDKITTLVSR
ncbi:MAG: hypothetical protein J6Z46_02875 [Lachnospiraceae bacterium]|nr:hypothetical protein [Lachnospiraceae bacterium]